MLEGGYGASGDVGEVGSFSAVSFSLWPRADAHPASAPWPAAYSELCSDSGSDSDGGPGMCASESGMSSDLHDGAEGEA